MHKLLATKKTSKRGFSLIELSVVITIVGILLYTTLSVGSAQITVSKIKQTNDKLDKIANALAIFYKTNNYLPCPASGSTLITDNTFGTSGGSGASTTCANANGNNSNVYTGVVPVRDLNLPDEFMFDGWNSRISYSISAYCVSKAQWNTANVYKCTTDGAATGADDGAAINIAGRNGITWPNHAAYVIISHGNNIVASYNRAGVRITTGASTASPKELANGSMNSSAADTYGATYYDMAINDGANAGNNFFDDIVRWSTAPQVDYNANH